MKKITWLTTLLIATSFNASADSFDNLIKDANSRLTFVEASGTCKVSYDGNEPNCQPVIAKCPKGTKLIKPLSKCSASAKSYYGNEVSISSNSWDAPFVLISYANYQEGFQQCNLSLSYIWYDNNQQWLQQIIAQWQQQDGITKLKVTSKAACTKLTTATETGIKKLLDNLRK